MTQSTEGRSPTQTTPGARAGRAGTPNRPTWWKYNPLLILLTAVVLWWLAKYVVPRYYRLNKSDIGIRLIPGNAWHYPVLVVHVVTATLAMLTGCLQMSGWLRRTRPQIHRYAGRIYVGSVLLAAPAAFGLVLFAIHRDGSRIGTDLSSFAVGSLVWATLWFSVTVRGFMLALQRRWVEHRRMMIYSFALTLAIMESRPLTTLAVKNTIHQFNLAAFFELMGWMPWVVHLLIAQWWLNRTANRPLVVPASALSRPAATEPPTVVSGRA